MTGGSTRPELRPYPHGSQSIASDGQLNVWLHDQRIGTGSRCIIPIAIRCAVSSAWPRYAGRSTTS